MYFLPPSYPSHALKTLVWDILETGSIQGFSHGRVRTHTALWRGYYCADQLGRSSLFVFPRNVGVVVDLQTQHDSLDDIRRGYGVCTAFDTRNRGKPLQHG